MKLNYFTTALITFLLLVTIESIAKMYFDNGRLRTEIADLKQMENSVIWQMDSSCYDQFKNNANKSLILKLTPVDE